MNLWLLSCRSIFDISSFCVIQCHYLSWDIEFHNKCTLWNRLLCNLTSECYWNKVSFEREVTQQCQHTLLRARTFQLCLNMGCSSDLGSASDVWFKWWAPRGYVFQVWDSTSISCVYFSPHILLHGVSVLTLWNDRISDSIGILWCPETIVSGCFSFWFEGGLWRQRIPSLGTAHKLKIMMNSAWFTVCELKFMAGELEQTLYEF